METDLKNLNNELEFVDDSDRDGIINVYKSWKTSLNRHIMITDIIKTKMRTYIKVDSSVYIDGVETFKNISNKSTLFISNCQNVNIILLNKINHVIIENSKNVTLKSTRGIIGGIDVLHSQNINFIVINQDIFYISLGEVSTSNIYIDKLLSLNTLISTLNSSCINFIHMVDEFIERAKFVTNNSILGGLYIMMFFKNDIDIFELHYIYQDCENRQREGIITPTF